MAKVIDYSSQKLRGFPKKSFSITKVKTEVMEQDLGEVYCSYKVSLFN